MKKIERVRVYQGTPEARALKKPVSDPGAAERDKNLYETLDAIAAALPEHTRDEFANLVIDLAGTSSRYFTVKRWYRENGYDREETRSS